MDTTLSIQERIRLHKLWLAYHPDGVKLVEHGDALNGADISGANLHGADLNGSFLVGADLRGADLSWANLHGTCFGGAVLRGADLRWSNTIGANFDNADLTGCNLNYSAWPLWGGTKGVIVDERIARQLIDHVIALKCDSEEIRAAQEWLKEHVGRSHNAEELGLIDGEDE